MAGLLVAGALAAIPLLIPSAADLGSHLATDHRSTQAVPYLERALAQAGPQRSIVMPLASVYTEQGQYEAALTLLRRLATAETTPALARMRQAALLGAGHAWALTRELEQLRRTAATAQLLTDLADLYGKRGLLELQIDALEQLFSVTPDDAALARRLAWLSVKAGDTQRALTLLQRFWADRPMEFLPTDFDLLVRLTIELDPSDAAIRLISDHGPTFGGAAKRVDFARHLYAMGRPRQARRLLDPLVATQRPAPEALIEWTRCLVALGDGELAFARLRDMADQPSSVVAGLLCELALERFEPREALTVAARARYEGLSSALMLRLGAAAASLGDRDGARSLLARLDERSLSSDPVTTTHMQLVAGSRAGARRWARRAQATEDLSVAQRLWLADLYLQLREGQQAAAVLQACTEQTPEVAARPLQLAMLWWRTGVYEPGLQYLQARLSKRAPSVIAGRALLLAASGRTGEALALLQGHPNLATDLDSAARELDMGAGSPEAPGARPDARALVRAWLSALQSAAAAHQSGPLIEFGHRQQLALRPGHRASRLALAQAQLSGGQHAVALATLRQLPRPLQGAEIAAWRAALVVAHRAGEPVTDELIAAALGHLKQADLRNTDNQSWVHLLLELDAARSALPFVEQLADLQGGSWRGKLIELHEKLGETDAALALWRARGADEDEPAATRLHAANQLLRAKERAAALRIYQSVAETEGSTGPTVRQLLHLWGPRADPAAVEWVAARARLAQGQARVTWLRHLLSIGGDRVALTLIGDRPPQGPLFDMLLQSRVARREHAAIAAMTLSRVAELTDPDLVRRLAAHCAAHGAQPAATKAWLRLLALSPGEPDALYALAQRAPAQAKQKVAWWRAWLASPIARRRAATWRDHVTFGDLLRRTGEREEGDTHLARALALLAQAPVSARTRALESGRLLARLDRPAEAAPLLAEALAARPCDDALRADLVAAWMATRDFDRARAAVDPPPRCRKRTSPGAGGSK